jgi:hypothetical protein
MITVLWPHMLVVGALLATVTFGAMAWTTEPGHTPLHIACQGHSHGPLRTQGAGRRLLDARAANRAARAAVP